MKMKGLVSLLFGAVFLTGCSGNEKAQKEQTPVSVEVQEIQLESHEDELVLSGNIEGNSTVRLGFMVAGKIDRIGVKEGQSVTKGQLLASLDAENYRIAKELASIQVNQVEDEYKRLQQMHSRGGVSDADFNKVGFALQQAKAQQKLQSKNVSDTRLNATINGVVVKKMAETGEIVATGTPVIVLSDIDRVKVTAFIPENELRDVQIGQLANVIIAALDTTVTGKVIEVGAAADAASRTFTVKIEIENKKRLIKPGMVAEVHFKGKTTIQSLLIPVEAIIHGNDGENYLFVVDPASKKAFRRKVGIGDLIGNRIEILSGINAGDLIVTGGQHKLSEGSKVQF